MNIILASGSPRRQQFLKDLGLDFEIRLKEIEEVYPNDLKGLEITDYLAHLKAAPFLNELQPNDVLITSDTIVWFENEAIGKPKDLADAKQILQKLSGKCHQVYTSVVLQSIDKQLCINETTHVYFNELTPKMIDFYVDTFQPLDKAGAYGIQEWIGLVGIEKIEGSYTNIVGLPVEKVYKALQNF